MPFRQIVLFVFIAALTACSTPPQKPAAVARGDYGYTKQYISWLIEQGMDDDDVTGLSIALVDDQQVVWAQGFGYEDKEAGIKATPDTPYHLGSIAKVFTATAAMQLAEQGRLDIDQPLQRYLPQFSIKSRFGDMRGITPRSIMTHHSGLPGYWVRGMSERHPAPFEDQVAAVRDEYVATPPGTVFAYSNLGYSLLGAAIGEVSGDCYAGYMNRYLLQPLGMTRSEFSARIPGKAYKDGKEVEAIPLRDLPSSSLISSASDMTRFVRMLFADGKLEGHQIIRPETLREMVRAQNENVALDFDFRMGLGWMLSGVDVPGAGAVVNHGGTTLNYHTMLALLPEHKLGVVVLSNSAGSQALVAKVTEETLRLALEAKRGIVKPQQQFVESRLAPLNADDLRDYAGYFETLIGLVKVENRKGALIAELMGWEFELVKHESGDFGVRLKLLGFIPVANRQMMETKLSLRRVGGREVLVYEKEGRAMLVGEKLHPQPLPEYLDDYVGEYDFVNPHDGPMPENVRIVREGDLLVGEFNSSIMPGFLFRTAFLPAPVQGELIMAGVGSGKGETLRVARVDGVPHVYFSGFELRKR
ncbi:MAG: beta-lactamase family protein [Gammaproteobacteria bacterium]|nr:beta-lactamase family protein [Gammaproteobacteria bacterium]MBU1968393.1 beta-lactamase family protein [Gammaproteobacteria bacterium]